MLLCIGYGNCRVRVRPARLRLRKEACTHMCMRSGRALARERRNTQDNQSTLAVLCAKMFAVACAAWTRGSGHCLYVPDGAHVHACASPYSQPNMHDCLHNATHSGQASGSRKGRSEDGKTWEESWVQQVPASLCPWLAKCQPSHLCMDDDPSHIRHICVWTMIRHICVWMMIHHICVWTMIRHIFVTFVYG
jgi:hypothetical protein